MSLNFVGSISVMDRGDAPAQAVLDRNARSLAKRVSDETKEELGKVMRRVEHVRFRLVIYFTYEFGSYLARIDMYIHVLVYMHTHSNYAGRITCDCVATFVDQQQL